MSLKELVKELSRIKIKLRSLAIDKNNATFSFIVEELNKNIEVKLRIQDVDKSGAKALFIIQLKNNQWNLELLYTREFGIMISQEKHYILDMGKPIFANEPSLKFNFRVAEELFEKNSPAILSAILLTVKEILTNEKLFRSLKVTSQDLDYIRDIFARYTGLIPREQQPNLSKLFRDLI